MRPVSLAVLGVAAFVVFLAVGVPASFVAARIAAATNGVVNLTDTQGTIWEGSGRAVIATPHALPVVIDNVSWRFNPARLIAAEMSFALRFTLANAAGEVEAARGFAGWKARSLAVKGEAGSLVSLVPLVATWQPGGEVTLTALVLAWDGNALAGEAQLEWRQASTSLSPVKPLGTYRAVVTATGGPAKVLVSTTEGALRITGEGSIESPSRWRFSGEARAEPAQAGALEPLLGLMGPKRADGAAGLEWRTR